MSTPTRVFVARTCALLSAFLFAALPARSQSLTAADLPGPDGIVYPDWRAAGIAGGIPTGLTVRATISAAQNTDIAAALESAAATAAAAGGGVVSIPAGTYNLSRPVMIRQSNVVIRGAGQGSTTLKFTFQAPTNAVTLFQNPAGATTLYNNTFIQAHADPNGLNRIAIYARKADGTLALITQQVKATGTWGNLFSIGTNGSAIRGQVGTGSHEVIGQAEYDDGRILTKTTTYTIQNSSDANAIPQPSMLGAINFCGTGSNTGNLPLTANATRGQKTVQLASGHGLIAGDLVQIHAPRTATWDAQTGNACVTSDAFRMCIYKIASVTATSLTFTQPFRIDYPIADGADVTNAYVKRFLPVARCGVEDLTLQQMYDVWTSGCVFSWGFECWVKNVLIKKIGRNPVYCSPAKFCEIRNCTYNDAWYKGEGGTAYCSFERSYDCLMDGITTYELRHAPLVQWSASGNVVRNGTFYDSDAQWHAGWANENLFENCTVLSNRGNGGYGYGLFATDPADSLHGPEGPRNAVYNCDVTSPLAAVWLGGSNKQWLFLHNRFAADTQSGLFAQKGSSNHIIEDNVFLVRTGGAAIELATADCTGVEVVDNKIHGMLTASDVALGAANPSVNLNNTVVDTLTPAPFTNAGFESDLTGWSIAGDNGMTAINLNAARTGAKGIRVTDNSSAVGSNLFSPVFNVTPGKVYAARASCRSISGTPGTGLYLYFYDSNGNVVRSTNVGVGSNAGWRLIEAIDLAPATAATARIQIHSYNASTQTTEFDDFAFGELANDIANPGFEYGLEGWDLAGDGTMSSATAGAAYSGSYGLHVEDPSTTAGSSCASRKFVVTPGQTYQTRFWSRITNGSGIGVYLQFLDSTNTALQPPTLLEVPVNSSWTENLYRAVAPANAATVRVWIHSYYAATVTADFDNFTFLALPPRPTPVTASIFDWQRNPVFPLANPGFEAGNLSGWSNAGDGNMTLINSSAARTGGYGIRVTDSVTTAGSYLLTPTFPVGEGYNYQVDFASRLISGSGIGVYLIYLDANGAEVGRYILGVPTNTTNWTPFTFQMRAPAGAVSAFVQIHSYNASIVTADFDDFSIKAVWD